MGCGFDSKKCFNLSCFCYKQEAFEFYIQQDSLYLIDFAKAIAITATKSMDVEDFSKLLHLADGALIAERELHNFYFQEFNIQPISEKQNACLLYTSFLLTTAYTRSYEESLVALLPCFYVYKEVGNAIREKSSADNPYSKWIETYSGEEFLESVNIMLKITQKAIESIDKDSKQGQRLMQLFEISTRLELLFWKDAYEMS